MSLKERFSTPEVEDQVGRIRFSQYLPGEVVSNEDLEREGITSLSGRKLTADRIENITGVVERRVAFPHETELFMAEKVFSDVLGDSPPDAILTSTSHPESSEEYPDGVNFSHHLKMKCEEAGMNTDSIKIMDVYAACSGFAVQLKHIFENIDEYDGKDVVLVQTERYSDTLQDLEKAIFTDRATAMRFRVNQDIFIEDALSVNRDEFEDEVNGYIQMPIDRDLMVEPYIEERVDTPKIEEGHDPRYFYQNGEGVKMAVLATVPPLIRDLDSDYAYSEEAGLPKRKLIPHQGSKQIVDREIARALPEYDVVRDYQEGNGSSTSIPRAMMKLFVEDKILPGEEVVVVGFGAGMHVTGVKLRFGGGEISFLESPDTVAEAA